MRLEHDIPLDGLREKLQGTLPTGIQVTAVESIAESAPTLQTEVLSAEYEIKMIEAGFGSDMERKIESLMATESMIRTRRGKEYDLRPLIEELSIMDDKIFMKLAAREGATGRPEEVLGVLGVAFEGTRIERKIGRAHV